MGIHFHRGNKLFDMGRTREALEQYLLEIAENPDFAIAHTNLAAARVNLGEIAEAQSAIKTALSLDPESPHAFYVLSYIHQAKGGVNSARDAILEAIRLANSAENQHRLAEIFAWNEDFKSTLEATSAALQLDPHHVPSILLRGKVLKHLGKNEAAQELFAAALNLDPEEAEAHHALGRIRLRQGDADEAMLLLSEARRLDPVHVNDKRAIAEAYGLNLPLFRFLNRYAVRWHLWPFLRKWQFAFVLTLLFCGAASMISFPAARRPDLNSVKLVWVVGCWLLTNYLMLPYTLPHLAKGAAMLQAKRELDVGWVRVGFELFSWVKALLMIVFATLLGLMFAVTPELMAITFAISTCFPLITAALRSRGKRRLLGIFVCLPLCLALGIIGTLGICLYAYAEPSHPESILAWPLILGFFATTFFSEKIANFVCQADITKDDFVTLDHVSRTRCQPTLIAPNSSTNSHATTRLSRRFVKRCLSNRKTRMRIRCWACA